MTPLIRRASARPSLKGQWDRPPWSLAHTFDIAHFHSESSAHRPRAQARALYDDEGLYVHFRVEDRYVRAVHTDYQSMVCRDSCAEFFAQPKADKGYFNFEMNCGGALLVSYVEDPTRTEDGFRKFQRLDARYDAMIPRYRTMPAVVEPEVTDPVVWQLEYFAPFALFEDFVGPLGNVSGQTWRVNFYKCGDETSHPHWASWHPVGEELNFHVPQHFAPVRFE